jgi:CBS domain-containing protein
MASVKLILANKGPHVHKVEKSSTVRDAAVKMNEHKVGALVVMEGARIAGVFTERDVLRRIVAEGRDPATTSVGEVMTVDVVCCREETKLDEARSVFKNRRIRHLPVVNERRELVGMISIGDLNAFESTDQEMTIQSLQEYLYGRT